MNTDTQSVRDKENTLKGFNKMYVGPIRNFQRMWFVPFIMGLGSVSMDNTSLRDTWNGVDIGGPNNVGGVGGAAVNANNVQIAQREGRIRRIYTIVLAYIDPTCATYDEIVENFADDGIAALLHLGQVGDIPYTPEEVTELENEWNTMTYRNIPSDLSPVVVDEELPRRWGNAVKMEARKFNVVKTNREQYTKFINGLPPQLTQFVYIEREQGVPGTDVYPALYPPNYPSVALRGQGHPSAGQPDMNKVIARYARHWKGMIKNGSVIINDKKKQTDGAYFAGKGKGKGKGGGKGNYYSGKGKGMKGQGKGGRGTSYFGGRGNGTPDNEGPRGPTEKTRCFKCGGLGHYANDCSTTIAIDKDILNGITYPHIDKARSADDETGDEAGEQENTGEDPHTDDGNYSYAEHEYEEEYEEHWDSWN